MKTVIYKDKTIKTNLGGVYPFTDGNDKNTMTMHIKKSCLESDKEMFERLAEQGYTRITFYRTATAVRGLYDTIAYCKR